MFDQNHHTKICYQNTWIFHKFITMVGSTRFAGGDEYNYLRPTIALWPLLEISVPKLGHDFSLLWLDFHFLFENSCSQGWKNCGWFTGFQNFWDSSKIAPLGAKFQAWVLGREFPKLAIVSWEVTKHWSEFLCTLLRFALPKAPIYLSWTLRIWGRPSFYIFTLYT